MTMTEKQITDEELFQIYSQNSAPARWTGEIHQFMLLDDFKRALSESRRGMFTEAEVREMLSVAWNHGLESIDAILTERKGR